MCAISEDEGSEEPVENSEMEEGSEGDEESGLSDGSEQRGEREKKLTKATPTPPGARDEIGSSLDMFPGTLSASRPEVREGAEAPCETNPLPQRPAEGRRTASCLSRAPETTGPAAKLAADGKAATPEAPLSSPNSEEEMDLATLIPAHKRLNLKLASRKAKKMKAQLKEKLKKS